MAQKINSGRRRVPRRAFEAPVGLLLHGNYTMEQSFQVGEGGMMVSSGTDLPVGTQAVLSFFLTKGSLIIVRGIVRSVVMSPDGVPERYGIEFLNLEFQFKREIRNFVAATTQKGGAMSL